MRLVAAAALITCSFLVPLPFLVRAVAFGAMGGYLLFTSVSGRCLGYRLMGKSTCPVQQRS